MYHVVNCSISNFTVLVFLKLHLFSLFLQQLLFINTVYYYEFKFSKMVLSGGSRISHGGVWTHWGGVDLRHRHFSVKMDAKMKELGPIGGHVPGTPPRSANGTYS